MQYICKYKFTKINTMETSELNSILESNNLVIIKFGTKWCHPCNTLEKILDDILINFNNIKFIKVDTDNDIDIFEHICSLYNLSIKSIPVTIFIKNNDMKDKILGLTNKSKIIEIIDKYV